MGQLVKYLRASVWLIPLLVTASLTAAGDQRLVHAAKQQDREVIRALLSQEVDVNATQPDGATALHWAAHWDDLETANLLLRAGAQAQVANAYYAVTPLSLACTNGSTAMVELLLNAGASANATLSTGETVLMTASRTGIVDVVRALLAHGADVNAVDGWSGQTALMWAVAEEHPEVVRVLVEHGADIAARSTGGFTPLLFAARQQDQEAVRLLLAAGADVNEVAADGSAALLVATVRGQLAVATLLLDHGADANEIGAGYTALHWAAGSWPTIMTGANGIAPEANGIVTDEDGWILLAGLRTGKLEFVKALLAHGANPNARLVKPPRSGGIGGGFRRSLVGATPFLLAAMAGEVAVMRTLVDDGADPQFGTEDNTTPLMQAAGLGRDLSISFVTEDSALEAVKLALTLGADVNAANNNGDTALHGAAFIKSNALVQLLVDTGAQVNAKNRRGETPLTVAEQVAQGGSRVRAQVRTSTGDLLRKLGGL